MWNNLHSFTSDVPGPTATDSYRGPLWPQDQPVRFEDKQSLAAYVNLRLRDNAGSFSLTPETPLVFSHMDISFRNLIFGDGFVCLLDWESAGYFPTTSIPANSSMMRLPNLLRQLPKTIFESGAGRSCLYIIFAITGLPRKRNCFPAKDIGDSVVPNVQHLTSARLRDLIS
ncbi:hypothetical protein BST61_g2967 [Cercospora zeina]